MPAISVIIPVYNAEDYLKEAVESVLAQTFADYELICVDDCSEDASYGILQEFAKKDARVVVLQTEIRENAGIVRNIGMDRARGEYLAFLDADDRMLPNALQDLFEAARKHDADYVKSRAYVFDAATSKRTTTSYYDLPGYDERELGRACSIFDGSDAARLIRRLPVAPWGALFRASTIRGNGIRFNDLFCVNDRSFQRNVLFNARRVVAIGAYTIEHRVNNVDSLIGKRGQYFECHFTSYYIIEEMTRSLPDELRQLFIWTEFSDICTWYLQYKKIAGVKEKTIEFLRSVDFEFESQAYDEWWYFTLYVLKHREEGEPLLWFVLRNTVRSWKFARGLKQQLLHYGLLVWRRLPKPLQKLSRAVLFPENKRKTAE